MTFPIIKKGLGVAETGFLALRINTEQVDVGNRAFTLYLATTIEYPLPPNPRDRVVTDPYYYNVDWGDGIKEERIRVANRDHLYTVPGIYTIRIYNLNRVGLMPAFDSSYSAKLVTEIRPSPDFNWVTNSQRCFSGCTNLALISDQLSTARALTLSSTWYNCTSLTEFPLLDFSNIVRLDARGYVTFGGSPVGTTFFDADANGRGVWENCTGLTSFVPIDTSNITEFNRAWFNCTGLTSFPLIDTSSAIKFDDTWRQCSSLTSFPLIDISNATSLFRTWQDCTSLTSFPLIDTSNIESFEFTWRRCSSLTSFPQIVLSTSKPVALNGAWVSCTGLTSFPVINTERVTSLSSAWDSCTGLTEFPLLDCSEVTIITATWRKCSGLTSFPFIEFPKLTSARRTWFGCTGLTEFPPIQFPVCTSFGENGGGVDARKGAWADCTGLTSFPNINMSKAKDLVGAWNGCTNLADFPPLVLPEATNITSTWEKCTALTTWEVVGLDKVEKAPSAFAGSGLITFPSTVTFPSLIGTDIGASGGNSWSGVGANSMFLNCTQLTTFPPNVFDGCTCVAFREAFLNCALTATSVNNILVSIESCGTSNGHLDLNGGTSAAPTGDGITAKNALIARGWIVNTN